MAVAAFQTGDPVTDAVDPEISDQFYDDPKSQTSGLAASIAVANAACSSSGAGGIGDRGQPQRPQRCCSGSPTRMVTGAGSRDAGREQERLITDRLTRWATRDGGDAAQVAAAIRAVLDEYLPGR